MNYVLGVVRGSYPYYNTHVIVIFCNYTRIFYKQSITVFKKVLNKRDSQIGSAFAPPPPLEHYQPQAPARPTASLTSPHTPIL